MSASSGTPVQTGTNEDKFEVYKLRAAEFGERYESMREREWQLLLQAYAGYAAIAIAFHYLQDKPLYQGWLLSQLAMATTLFFFLATQYMLFRIQERLINFNENYDTYVNAIHRLKNVPILGAGTSSLRHQYFWTYDTQVLLSLLVLSGLLTYEAAAIVPLAKIRWMITPFLFIVAGGILAG